MNSKQQLKYKELVRRMEKVPMLSSGSLHLMNIASDSDVDIDQLVAEIEKNQAVVFKILSIANSAYFNPHGSQILDVKAAVIKIGLNLVGGMVVSILLTGSFSGSKSKLFESKTHWLEAVMVASLVAELSRINKIENADFLYTAGLLHNLGILLLVELMPEEMDLVLAHGKPYEKGFEYEVNVLVGVNSFQSLAWLLRKWDVPRPFIEVIGHLESSEYDGHYLESVGHLNTARQLARHILLDREELAESLAPYELLLTKTKKKFSKLVKLANSMSN